MKKKIMLTATAAALAAMMIVGGTIAWFTDTAEVTNVITLGNIDISLRESDGDGYTEEGLQFGAEVPLTPGEELPKDPYVVNVGKNDAWVRILVELEGTILEVEAFDFDAITDFNTTNWTRGTDGYYYYNEMLEAGDDTERLFTTVTIPETWGNAFADTDLEIIITAEAVQVDNLGVNNAIDAFALDTVVVE